MTQGEVESDAATTEAMIRSLYSPMAASGTWGYWGSSDREVTWSFDAGIPDPATFPVDDLIRLSEGVLRRNADDALQYGAAKQNSIICGYPGLRRLLADRAQRPAGPAVDVDGVMLTSGSIQAIALTLQAFLGPGDVMALEAPTWNAVVARVRQLGIEAVAVPLDDEGMMLDVLEDRLDALDAQGKRLKLLYTIATFNTPTGRSLSEPRRRRLLELARRRQFLVVEDSVYEDLRYEGRDCPACSSSTTRASCSRSAASRRPWPPVCAWAG